MYKILIFIFLFLLLIFNIPCNNIKYVEGGYNEENIIIDTLNLVHFFNEKINKDIIISTILSSSFDLRNIYKDKIIYILKFINNPNDDYIDLLKNISSKYNIIIYAIIEYDFTDKKINEHVEKGRDDFLAIYLANKYNCKILSNDKYRDLKKMKKIEKFMAYGFYPYKMDTLHINPKNIDLHKIHTIPIINLYK